VADSNKQLSSRAKQWHVAIDEVRETEGSLLAFGVRDGRRVVLKISKRAGDELNSGDVLRAFNGDGTVRVYESAEGAVLLERLDPGAELVELVRASRDDEATSILAEVIKRMSNHQSPGNCATVHNWAMGFDRYINQYGTGPIPLALVEEAASIYRSLAASQKQLMLLHGDLHHYNVLFDTDRGWVAIDPKGVIGELEYELGAIIRNPVELPELYISCARVERRLRALTTVLNLDYRRAVEWGFAQAVLSAIWDLEDGFEVLPGNPSIQLAEVIKSLL
jgi:streptomycin 6-kinase